MATFVGAPYALPGTSTGLTNAQAQAWVSAVRTALTSVGLVQTADTGQLDPATATWPAGSGNMGYLVFRFNDPQQATDPVSLKITFRRGTSAGRTETTVQVGQGSDGAGNLTGQLSSAYSSTFNGSVTTGSALQEYVCFKDGALFWGHRYSEATGRVFHTALSVERTRASDGSYDAQGVSILYMTIGAAWRAQSVRWLSSPATYNANASFCIVPGLPTDTANSSGDKQLYPHFYNIPAVQQRWSSFTVRNSEFGVNPTTFTASPTGTPRTFLSCGSSGVGYMIANVTDNASFGPCFLWE